MVKKKKCPFFSGILEEIDEKNLTRDFIYTNANQFIEPNFLNENARELEQSLERFFPTHEITHYTTRSFT